MKKGNQRLIREHNAKLVLNLLREEGSLSRAQLSRRSGLAPSALTRQVRHLLDREIVVETGKQSSQGGRRGVLLSLNSEHAFAVGVKVERTRLLTALVNLEGKILNSQELDLDGDVSPEPLVRAIGRSVATVCKGELLGVGVAVSGFVDPFSGHDYYSPILGWHDVPFQAMLQSALDCPIWIENDVNALALAESWFGAGRGANDFVCVTVGEGVGAGLVLNNSLYRGTHGGAGELGHTCVQPEGLPCRCGQRGCLETLASDSFLKAAADRLAISGIAELASLARAGSKEAIEPFQIMGRSLGAGVVTLVNLLNPERIVLGGERMDVFDLFFEPFREFVESRTFPHEAADLEILPWELDAAGFVIGAATLPIASFFQLPTGGRNP